MGSVNARTVKMIKGGFGTVLGGDVKAIDNAHCDRFRIRFRTNAMKRAFFAGFVHSQADTMDLNESLGFGAKEEHSVGICVGYKKFFLFDKENKTGRSLSSHLSWDIAFPVSEQEWLVEFDFVAHSLCLFLRLPKRWTLATQIEML